MNHWLFRLALVLMVAVAFASCEDGLDSEQPTAQVQTPMDGATVTTADGLSLVINFADNGELIQYKILIEGIDSLNGIAKDTMFRYIFIEGLSRGEFQLQQTIALPDTVFNGFYRIIVSCVDGEGNQAYNDTVSIRIVNSLDSVPPIINGSGPTPNDTLRFGEGFVLGGNITDEQSLNYVTFKIARLNGTYTHFSFDYPFITENIVDFDPVGLYFSVDSTWEEGAYGLSFTAWDNANGVADTIPFHVKY